MDRKQRIITTQQRPQPPIRCEGENTVAGGLRGLHLSAFGSVRLETTDNLLEG